MRRVRFERSGLAGVVARRRVPMAGVVISCNSQVNPPPDVARKQQRYVHRQSCIRAYTMRVYLGTRIKGLARSIWSFSESLCVCESWDRTDRRALTFSVFRWGMFDVGD